MTRAAEWFWIVALFLFLNLTFASTQPASPQEGSGGESQAYHAIALSLPHRLPLTGSEPYLYRIGMPLAAAGVAKTLDWVISAGFDRLDLVFNLVSVIALALLLRRKVGDWVARALVLGAFMIEPHSPVRLSYFHPISVDSALVAFLLTGLLAVDMFHARPSPRAAALVAALVTGGVLFHEGMLLVGVVVLFFPASDARRSRWAELERSGAWLPIVAGLVTYMSLHWIATPPLVSRIAPPEPEISPVRFAVAWFLVFGPSLAVLLWSGRRAFAAMRAEPARLVWIAVLASAALWRGEREWLLVLAGPVVWVLIAQSLEWRRVHAGTAVFAATVVLQVLSSRLFAPIGGPIDPPAVGAEIWERLGSASVKWMLSDPNMWTQTCAPSMLLFYVLWYALSTAMVIVLLRTSERARA